MTKQGNPCEAIVGIEDAVWKKAMKINKYSGPDAMGSTRKQDHVRDEEHENVRALISRSPQSCYTRKHKKKLPESNKGSAHGSIGHSFQSSDHFVSPMSI
jgi:hypothetical protein